MTYTRTKILDLAEHLTQTKGFNGFSYLDLAAEIGVKNSSIHYHFKAKADLALALVERLRETHSKASSSFDQQFSKPEQRLSAIVEHFKGYIHNKKFCMCGMMTAELESVSPDVKKVLAHYFRDVQRWLTKQFFELNNPALQQAALQFLSALEGSLLLARLEDDPSIVSRSVDNFVKT